MKSKMIALALAAVMLFGCLAGCGNGDSSSASSTPSSSADSSAASSTPAPEATPEATPAGPSKYETAYAKFAPEDVVLTLNGTEVTWEEYFYWLYSICFQVEYYYPDLDWSEPIGEGSEMTYQDNAFDYAEGMLGQYVVIENAFKESGLQLSEEDQADLDNVLQLAADNNTDGDVDAFVEMMATQFLTADYYYYLCAVNRYYATLFADQFGENGELLSAEDAIAYAVDQGYMYAKHILFLTVDPNTGVALDEATIAEKKATAEDVVAQLKACGTTEEMLALFDSLEAQYNEDSGRTHYPDGYYFLEGEMVAPFENAVKALEENAVSDIVESDYGYHIILRPTMDADVVVEYDAAGNGYTLRYVAASGLFNNITAEWFTDVEIEYTEKFASLDLNELFAQ